MTRFERLEAARLVRDPRDTTAAVAVPVVERVTRTVSADGLRFTFNHISTVRKGAPILPFRAEPMTRQQVSKKANDTRWAERRKEPPMTMAEACKARYDRLRAAGLCASCSKVECKTAKCDACRHRDKLRRCLRAQGK